LDELLLIFLLFLFNFSELKFILESALLVVETVPLVWVMVVFVVADDDWYFVEFVGFVLGDFVGSWMVDEFDELEFGTEVAVVENIGQLDRNKVVAVEDALKLELGVEFLIVVEEKVSKLCNFALVVVVVVVAVVVAVVLVVVVVLDVLEG